MRRFLERVILACFFSFYLVCCRFRTVADNIQKHMPNGMIRAPNSTHNIAFLHLLFICIHNLYSWFYIGECELSALVRAMQQKNDS